MVHNNNNSTTTGISRVVGGAAAGFLELAVFHPVDTIIKRLMFNKGPSTVTMAGLGGGNVTITNYSSIIFRDQSNASTLQKYKSLFPGFKFALGYKVLQRTYKFGGQPVVYDAINSTPLKQFAHNNIGDVYGKVLVNGIAGAILGVGEVILLPLDVLKIKMQTNPNMKISLLNMKIKELYKGGGWTMARNGPGSFALFGTSAFITHSLLGVRNAKEQTFLQTTIASCGGAAASIIIAQPLDVIKTRIQGKAFGAAHESGFNMITNMIKTEGISSFSNGLLPKLLTIGPKLAFSLTVAQYIMYSIQNKF